jgi:iron complex outermembrane receptor protein
MPDSISATGKGRVGALQALVFALVASHGGTTALAQDAQFVEEIIVTAQKREQAALDVPIALSVVSAQEIEDRSISDFTELFDLMPNTTIDQNVSSIPRIAIRGISSNVNNIGIESGVGVVVDEVYIGRPSAFSANLIDIERVEVLRGPQGTLFGKNIVGGLVNVVTSKPKDQFGAEADVTFGDDDLRQFRGYVTGPILRDGLNGKISATVKEQDGWVKNTNPAASDLMSVDFWGLRGQLMGTPSDSFSWLLTAEYSEDDSVENYNDILDGALAPLDGDPFDRTIGTSENDLFEREIYGVSLTLDWSWDDLQLVSVSAARGVDWTGRNDQDYSVLRLFETGRTEDQDQISQELRLVGGDDDFNWVAGLYYFDQSQDGLDFVFVDEDLPPVVGAPAIPGYNESVQTRSSIDTTSVAAFLSGTYQLTDRWSLTAGLRYTREEKDLDYRQDVEIFEVAPGVPVGIILAFNPPVAPFSDSLTDNDWSGDISLGYRFSDRVRGYAKIARGFKAGGFDSTASPVADPGSLQFDAETVVSYEAGLKSEFADGRARLNLAAFYSDYEDKQEQFFNGIIQVTANAAAAEITGFEADLNLLATDWLTIGGAIGYQSAEYDEYVDPLAGTDYSGNELADIPQWTGAFFTQVDRELANGWSWMARIDVAYEDEVFNRPSNDPDFTGEDSTLVDARIGLSTPGNRYGLYLWSKNLLDEDYIRRRSETLGTRYLVLNRPRSWGIELRGRFGD